MLKCEKLMQEELLKMTKDKVYRMGRHEDLSHVVAFSFIKHLNNILKETDTFIKSIRQDYVLLYTVYAKRENIKVKLVDFAISIDIDEENDLFSVTDCYATYWPEDAK